MTKMFHFRPLTRALSGVSLVIYAVVCLGVAGHSALAESKGEVEMLGRT